MLKSAQTDIMVPALNRLLSKIKTFAHEYAEIPMLARTHDNLRHLLP